MIWLGVHSVAPRGSKRGSGFEDPEGCRGTFGPAHPVGGSSSECFGPLESGPNVNHIGALLKPKRIHQKENAGKQNKLCCTSIHVAHHPQSRQPISKGLTFPPPDAPVTLHSASSVDGNKLWDCAGHAFFALLHLFLSCLLAHLHWNATSACKESSI